ncbi:MAG: AAA family ATPase [Chloroflexota bacterium]
MPAAGSKRPGDGAAARLPEVARALLAPGTYPEATKGVELVQTQMSFVFLTDQYVYKVKKPVNLGYLDYTTLEQRRLYCQREVALNRRLCPEAYLAVVPITRQPEGVALGGPGEPIEYAVKMRRLPQEAMMNVLLAGNRVSPEMVSRLAVKLADFHQHTATGPDIDTFGGLETITRNTEENFSQTERYIPRTISQEQYRRITQFTRDFIRQHPARFRQRVDAGRIRDCHGDLHAAHICFSNGICIYDCIEFNERFRYCDVASEVAFLTMDLDHYGRADLSRHFIKAYVSQSQDEALKGLLGFYRCYRAYVRGKVEGFKLDDPYIAPAEKAKITGVARRYFSLAQAYTRPRPRLIITVGLVGSGKSTLAQALAQRLGLVVISSDVTRKQLAAVPATEHHFDSFDSGIYSAEFTRRTYDRMFAEAGAALADGWPVIIDASFINAKERQTARELARDAGADFFIIECVLDETHTRQRLARRLKRGSASDGRWEIYPTQKERFEPVAGIPPANHVIIDTSGALSALIKKIEARID